MILRNLLLLLTASLVFAGQASAVARSDNDRVRVLHYQEEYMSFVYCGSAEGTLLIRSMGEDSSEEWPVAMLFDGLITELGSLERGILFDYQLPDGRWLTRQSVHGEYEPFTQPPPYRETVRLQLMELADGASTNVTPNGLGDIELWSFRALPRACYSEEFGLALFVNFPNSKRLELWQGHDELALLQEFDTIQSRILARTDGRLAPGLIDGQGQLRIYDLSSGRINQVTSDDELGWLAQALPDGLGVQDVKCTGRYAAWRDKDSKGAVSVVVLKRDGTRLEYPAWPAADFMLDGDFRTGDTTDPDIYLEEGATAPAHLFTNASMLLPYSETELALFDMTYNRIIVLAVE